MLKLIKLASGTNHSVHLNGVKKQAVDERDKNYQLKVPAGIFKLPTIVDNRNICSEIEDQGSLGSCTAQTIVGLLEANQNRAILEKTTTQNSLSVTSSTSGLTSYSDGSVAFTSKLKPSWKGAKISSVTLGTASVSGTNINFTASVKLSSAPTPANTPQKFIHGSRLFQYYATRRLMNTVTVDSGASIRDSIKAAANYGSVDEALWPYVISKYATNPSSNIWTTAATKKITSYHAIADGDLDSIKSALYNKYLVAFGFLVYSHMVSTEMSKSGLLRMPLPNESYLGGHAVCLVGYDDDKVMPDGSKGAFLVRNSWGTSWGINGYFYMPYRYVGNPDLSWDFWVIKSSTLA